VVEVRLRGSLSARRWSASCRASPVATARLRFFLFFLAQQPNCKAVTSLSVENELIILLRSSCFLPFLVEAVPKVLDVPFPVSSTPSPVFVSSSSNDFILSNGYEIMYDVMY
jgi:hypothetical protein